MPTDVEAPMPQFRTESIQNAIKYAMETPYKVMETAFEAMGMVKTIAEIGNPNSASDAGVGALALRTAVLGASMNVKINASGLDDKQFVANMLAKAEELEQKGDLLEKDIVEIAKEKFG